MAKAEFAHGGDILTYQAQSDIPILDFSANLNPLGMPEQVCRAAQRAVEESDRYPDPFCRQLSAAIATRDAVEPEQVLCGNGAADLIFRLVYSTRPKSAMVTAPTFCEYEQALEAAGCRVLYHELKRGQEFSLTASILDALEPGLDMLFLCNPNNPTGRQIQPGLLEKILTACLRYRIRLVLDECFLALSDHADSGGLAAKINEYPNLILLRAFTKSHAMAGLRLGYCLSSDLQCLRSMTAAAQPWSVSAPAQAGGLAALDCPEHPARAREIIAPEREALTGAMRSLGLWACPSQANYLLFCCPGQFDLKERLLPKGVLIRSCGNYRGLAADYYRVAVRMPRENRRLITALKEVL